MGLVILVKLGAFNFDSRNLKYTVKLYSEARRSRNRWYHTFTVKFECGKNQVNTQAVVFETIIASIRQLPNEKSIPGNQSKFHVRIEQHTALPSTRRR